MSLLGSGSTDYDKLLFKVKQRQDKESEANQGQDIVLHNTQQLNNVDKNEQFKKQFESRLSPDTLKSFKEAGNHWTSNPTYGKLFLFWKSLTSPGSLESQKSILLLRLGRHF